MLQFTKWKIYRKRPTKPYLFSVCRCTHQSYKHKVPSSIFYKNLAHIFSKRKRKELPEHSKCEICMCNDLDEVTKMTHNDFALLHKKN